MGWASYFEDIARREAEAEHSSRAFVSPAGTPPSSARGTGMVTAENGGAPAGRARTVPDLLSAAYSRLESYYREVVKRCQAGQWQNLSARMDKVEQKVRLFDKKTLFAGEGSLYEEEALLSREIEDVLLPARKVLRYLSSLVDRISSELKGIARLKKAVGQSAIPYPDRDLEQQAMWSAHGCKALREQVDELEQRAARLKVELDDNLAVRLMANPSMKVQDKDAPAEDDR